MPLPTPRDNETRNDFVNRCIGNEQSKKDFPDIKQRLAVCNGRYGEE